MYLFVAGAACATSEDLVTFVTVPLGELFESPVTMRAPKAWGPRTCVARLWGAEPGAERL
jgi:hypothetical protein